LKEKRKEKKADTGHIKKYFPERTRGGYHHAFESSAFFLGLGDVVKQGFSLGDVVLCDPSPNADRRPHANTIGSLCIQTIHFSLDTPLHHGRHDRIRAGASGVGSHRFAATLEFRESRLEAVAQRAAEARLCNEHFFHGFQASIGVLENELPLLLPRAEARQTIIHRGEWFKVAPALGKSGRTVREGAAHDGPTRNSKPGHENIHDQVSEQKSPEHDVVFDCRSSTFTRYELGLIGGAVHVHDARLGWRQIWLASDAEGVKDTIWQERSVDVRKNPHDVAVLSFKFEVFACERVSDVSVSQRKIKVRRVQNDKNRRKATHDE
jgi:hypothetical protein